MGTGEQKEMTNVAELMFELSKTNPANFVCVVDHDGHLHQFEVEVDGGVVKLVIA